MEICIGFYIYIDDITEELRRVIQKNPQKDDAVYNIGNGKPKKILYMVEYLENALGEKSEKDFCSIKLGDVYQTYAEVTALQREFGYRPDTALEDGINQFAEWFKYYKGL